MLFVHLLLFLEGLVALLVLVLPLRNQPRSLKRLHLCARVLFEILDYQLLLSIRRPLSQLIADWFSLITPFCERAIRYQVLDDFVSF